MVDHGSKCGHLIFSARRLLWGALQAKVVLAVAKRQLRGREPTIMVHWWSWPTILCNLRGGSSCLNS